jgi:hypothetical protein
MLAMLLSACSTVEPAAPATATAAPRLRFIGNHSFEEKNPGYGVSHRYTVGTGWADFYVYGLQREPWAAGVSDPGFAAHFQSTIAEVQQAAQSGHYDNLQLGRIGDERIGGHDFRRLSFRFTRDGKAMESATYLTAINGKLLKLRLSVYSPSVPDVNEVARQCIQQYLADPENDLRT